MAVGKQWVEIEADFCQGVLNLDDRISRSHQ